MRNYLKTTQIYSIDMSEKTVFNLLKELKQNLLFPSIVFFPLDYVQEYGTEEEIKNIITAFDPFDKIILASDLENTKILSDNVDVSILLKKSEILLENLFTLKSYQEKLNNTEFTFLIDKYIEYVYGYLYFSNLLLKTFLEVNSTEYHQYESLFILQNENFKTHFFEVIDLFPNNKSEYLFNNSDYEEERNENLITFSDKVKLKKTVKKTKKKNLITDEQARNYLLETVFSVNFSDNDN